MDNTGPTSAWNFLQRNSGYIEDLRKHAEPAPAEPAPFPLRQQTEGDLKAAWWGLLAWEDPSEGGPTSPFWVEAPMLEAVPVPEAPPLAALLDEPHVKLWGLRLVGGAVIVKVEKGDASVQVLIGDGAPFDPAGGVELLRLSPARDLQKNLRRVARLWPVGGAASKKDASGVLLRKNFSWLSTDVSPARAIA